MWLVALKLPARKCLRILQKCGLLQQKAVSPIGMEVGLKDVGEALSTLFDPSDEYWQGVIQCSSGMRLSAQAEAEERGRRCENLERLHHSAVQLEVDIMQPSAVVGLLAPCDRSFIAASAWQRKDITLDFSPLDEDDSPSMPSCENTSRLESQFNQYFDGTGGFERLCSALGIQPGITFHALVLAFCCGSRTAESLSSRQEFFRALSKESCDSMDHLQALLPSMVQRISSPEASAEFWEWVFHAVSTRLPSDDGLSAFKKPRLQEKASLTIDTAHLAMKAAAPCLGSPPLLPLLAQFFQRATTNRNYISFDTWQMTRVFLLQFSSVEALGAYDDLDGEFPSFFDSFVDDIRGSNILVDVMI